MALWCLYTMINLLIGHNPLRPAGQEVRHVKAQYERLLADSKAKEDNTKMMLAEQRANFEAMAKSLEEKHQTLSQIMGSSASSPLTGTAKVEYANNRVLMAPIIRDTQPRQSRRDVIQTASLNTGLSVDSSLNVMGETQDVFLINAEAETLDKIERNRALIRATDMDVDTVLSEAKFGKGGPYIPLDMSPRQDGNQFMPRVTSIQARVAEVDALEDAVTSLPTGHPINGDTYQTSSFGVRKDPFTKRPTFHQGLDFGGRRMTEIVATADGVVTYVGRKGAYGRIVEIDHGHGFKTRYAHLQKTFVKRGQNVDKGTKIANTTLKNS